MIEAMATASAPAQAEAADLVGRWEGAIRVGDASIPVVIRVAQGPDGLIALMDSPAQNARDIPVAGLTETSGVVRFTVPMAGGRFEGARSGDGSTWTGTLSQGPASMPLILTRTAATAEVTPPPPPRRPQTPVPPFPYAAEEVTFPNAGAGITLAGTLTLPRGEGPFPAVILLTGSGPQDRDETILDHKPFAVWADALTRRGIAVLRYDDRGMGGSGGGSSDETTADFATDAVAGMDFLRARPDIDAARLGLMGHSEGGLTALIASSNGAPAAFVVMIAGPSVSGADILTEQVKQIVLASGGTEAQALQTEAIQARFMLAVLNNRNDGPAAARAIEAVAAEIGQPAAQASVAARQMSSGWYRYFTAFDPADAIRALNVPMLAIYAERDRNVPAEQNASHLRSLKPDAEIVVLPGLNHLMQPATTGLPGEYATITQTLAPEAITAVTDWVARVAEAP
ncbi:alpha/beta fold hydrolase [Brevundimonas sp.]|uniref:alpha/beta hydrolase family protein n=1 Tax=Brevundimonas sp. TaxID=1871086 RepID=UPI00286C0F98|nr:alpha/beta fold hydrolase [Brevundimonas sp.]